MTIGIAPANLFNPEDSPTSDLWCLRAFGLSLLPDAAMIRGGMPRMAGGLELGMVAGKDGGARHIAPAVCEMQAAKGCTP